MNKPRRKWRKILYGNEGYPDNYTDVSFLDEMKKNINMHQVTLKEAILGAGLVTQEFCLVVLFIVIFMYLHNGWLPLELILAQTGVVSLFCYVICIYNESGRLRHVRTVLVFFIFGYILSPVLKTLTESISTDTIYATTVFMMSVHLIFFDYGVKALIVSSSLSLNSAIFGAICLSSRLPSSFHVFILLCLTVECFVMLPLVLAKVEGSFGTLFTLTCLTVYSLWTVSFTMTVLFVLVVLFINVLCPVWFLKWYRYKENIYGPWDEAVVVPLASSES
ncbi:phosphatidylinositol N-acetylglucosaminyltransferase subunit C-like isoform X2 [Macrosteles quadrilineatus]|uniref:phosphatidylinositol N-acetylglucosaminyltransferase subunit C-like n=1 Tax=Macrosteles quadrilineatus TaxID=74068 RepID=UPI0023E0953F|nr:phosphatidylinositol N-acetylglucosaminyltransferase subunit C-like [Macrosteles quadrilineatus]XP_054278696.1 phosphatidylinositol N-acetylglucosaminyltransferase subunit C-like isoform X2 [Macrosteles quadrilineatus]